MLRTACISLTVLLLAGCAVNRVEEVKSPSDAESLYKVPVVYGVGVVPGSMGIDGFGAAFAEYDPVTKQGTSSCLGSADMIWLKTKYSRKGMPQDNSMQYHVLMVPPGYYVAMGNAKFHEGNPSLYFKVEGSKPLYLGNFWLNETRNTGRAPATLMVSPVEYHPDEAAKILAGFDIQPDQMQQIPLLPTDGFARFIICGP